MPSEAFFFWVTCAAVIAAVLVFLGPEVAKDFGALLLVRRQDVSRSSRRVDTSRQVEVLLRNERPPNASDVLKREHLAANSAVNGDLKAVASQPNPNIGTAQTQKAEQIIRRAMLAKIRECRQPPRPS